MRTPSCGTAITTCSAETAICSGSSPSSIPSDSAPRIVGILGHSACPATSASAPRALALEADMGGAASWGMRKGRTILPRRLSSWRRPCSAPEESSPSCESSAGTTSSIARCPMALSSASNATAAAARTSASPSHSAMRTVDTTSSRNSEICWRLQLATTSLSPRHTPARCRGFSSESSRWRMGMTSLSTRSPSLLTISPIARPATAFFSSEGEARHTMSVSMSTGRMVLSVRSCDCTTLFHTWKEATQTEGFMSERSM
mmetsp:Transcript_39032/g.79909  ORF Transcript_39032/g.79909 Transcript_39032/m.79909 type:complete len:259 (+) Transcript_39032:1833-2609(+)